VPEFDRYHNDRFTGYIDLEIQALTPLYIRDTLTMDEYKKRDKMEKEKKTFINPDFFSPGGILRIPGSSLRGMIRTLVEIVSFGKFESFDDKRLYYRGLADVSSLRKEYQRHMSSRDREGGRAQYKMSAGILRKEGFNYFITPAKTFRQIPKLEARRMIEAKGKKYEEFRFYEVEDGYMVVSGTMQNKKRDWLIEYPDKEAKPIPIHEDDIKNYKNDSNRSKNVPDLLKLASQGVPCFYTRYKDIQGRERIAFGHTAMFRLPYQKTIGDHVPTQLKDKEITDLATAIFGETEKYASRVFFEDAIFDGEPQSVLMKTEIPKILSGPKPTCFQHYIEQKTENLQNHPKNLAHYNSDNPIRGYKLYWHRDANNWIETDKENIAKHGTQYTKITPVKKGTIFHGRIRFENLSKVELGALLFVLDLPEGLAHKLGMAKPLGLGSVRIKPVLYLSDRQKRYKELFSEWNGIEKSADINGFKKAFENYVLNKLDERKQSLWEIDRLKELKRMLDIKSKPDNNKTAYMELGEFRQRKILPKPMEL
jgi:CRISPR/Cas system CSM-associated protein Csm3 (group 7 of RAMP superfamily)